MLGIWNEADFGAGKTENNGENEDSKDRSLNLRNCSNISGNF